jgi:hypothetical protein
MRARRVVVVAGILVLARSILALLTLALIAAQLYTLLEI